MVDNINVFNHLKCNACWRYSECSLLYNSLEGVIETSLRYFVSIRNSAEQNLFYFYSCRIKRHVSLKYFWFIRETSQVFVAFIKVKMPLSVLYSGRK
jgi:hypothetical protein